MNGSAVLELGDLLEISQQATVRRRGGDRHVPRALVVCFALLVCVGTSRARAESVGEARAADDLRRAILEHDARLLRRDPQLVAEKYVRMARTPFSFFRGTACLGDQSPSAFSTPAASRIAITGDSHPENVEVIETGTAHLLAFNDFDLAGYGSYVEDLRRSAVGFWITADMAKFKRKQRARVVEALVDGYVAEAGARDRQPAGTRLVGRSLRRTPRRGPRRG